MGSWDCYCAICGGPHTGVEISPKPRSARFKRRLGKKAENNSPEIDSDNETYDEYEARRATGEVSEDEEEIGEVESEDEEHSYDPEIVTQESVAWVGTLHVLGFNASSQSAFLSGPGRYDDYGIAQAEPGSDPNFDPNMVLCCYYNQDHADPVFPFHWCCWDVLVRCLARRTNGSSVAKESIYNLMYDLTLPFGSRLNLDYGNPPPPDEQYWTSTAGEEIFVSCPIAPPGFEERVRSIILGPTMAMKPTAQSQQLASRVRSDDFRRLSYNLLHCIADFLPADGLLNLVTASWHANAILDCREFWLRRIRHDLPWFSELLALLQDAGIVAKVNLKKVLSWADELTRPRLFMHGEFMPVANRRRIWGVCDQLAAIYEARKHQGSNPKVDSHFAMIRSSSVHFPIRRIAGPIAAGNYKESEWCYWLRSWSDVETTAEKLLQTFWISDGSLVGMSLSLGQGPKRVLNGGIAEEALAVQSYTIGAHDWITAAVIHVAPAGRTKVVPKGITVWPAPAFSWPTLGKPLGAPLTSSNFNRR
jgi:hypothetical protein